MAEEDKIKTKIRKNKVVTDNYLNFLLELYINDPILVTQEQLDILLEYQYLKPAENNPEEGPVFEEINQYATVSKTKEQAKIDSKVDILEEDDNGSLLKILNDKDLNEKIKTGGYLFSGRKEEITVKEWMPESITEHTKEFVDWITSITLNGFSKRKSYSKLNLYVQQAYTWLSEDKTLSDFDEIHDKEEFILEELNRCSKNTLYFVNKYAYYFDGNLTDTGGVGKYTASPAHEIIMYLDDCGYSTATAKGRQMAYTTTKQLCNLKSVMFRKNSFILFVTEDKTKAEQIFEQKLKFPYSKLPDWFKQSVSNDSGTIFKLGEKEKKGDRDGSNSSITVVAPKDTVIAGNSPTKADIDEAGNIGILSKMIEDQRPTMYVYNPVTKKMEIKRQLSFYGTGGELEKGGKAFETEFMAIWNAWLKGDFSSGIIPLFFDWTARSGNTQKIYDENKRVAYAKEGIDAKKSRIKFHQGWPATLSDVFKTSGKTLIDEEFIKVNKERIIEALGKTNHSLVKHGYFEPIYDETKPNDEHSHLPFKVIGAQFIPTDDLDPRGVVTMFLEPDRKYINRYFGGTDPIMSDSGLSEMASAIWDKWLKTISCVVSFRTNDPREMFLQCALMNIYYDPSMVNKKSIKQLVESNIGPPYTNYVIALGYEESLTLNYELPPYLQNHSTKNEGIGVDNKNPRTGMIINKLQELLSGYGERLFIERIFSQLETFVCTVTPTGNETWGPSNKKHFKDDILFACVYAYICGEYCYPELIPMNMSSEKNKFKWVRENYHDKDWNLHTRMVKKPVLNND